MKHHRNQYKMKYKEIVQIVMSAYEMLGIQNLGNTVQALNLALLSRKCSQRQFPEGFQQEVA